MKMKMEMLIRVSEFDDPRSQGKYYVCFASDGSPVSNTTDYQYFNIKKDAKKFIKKNNGKNVTKKGTKIK